MMVSWEICSVGFLSANGAKNDCRKLFGWCYTEDLCITDLVCHNLITDTLSEFNFFLRQIEKWMELIKCESLSYL